MGVSTLFRRRHKKTVRESRALSPKSGNFWALFFNLNKGDLCCLQKSSLKVRSSHWVDWINLAHSAREYMDTKNPSTTAGTMTPFVTIDYFRLNFFASLYIVVTSFSANSLRLVFT